MTNRDPYPLSEIIALAVVFAICIFTFKGIFP